MISIRKKEKPLTISLSLLCFSVSTGIVMWFESYCSRSFVGSYWLGVFIFSVSAVTACCVILYFELQKSAPVVWCMPLTKFITLFQNLQLSNWKKWTTADFDFVATCVSWPSNFKFLFFFWRLISSVVIYSTNSLKIRLDLSSSLLIYL